MVLSVFAHRTEYRNHRVEWMIRSHGSMQFWSDDEWAAWMWRHGWLVAPKREMVRSFEAKARQGCVKWMEELRWAVGRS